MVLEFKKRVQDIFELQAAEVSRSEVTFLQVKVLKKNGRIATKPVFKPASLGVPLAASSGHPSHVYFTWPVAVARGLMRLATAPTDAREAVEIVVSRLQAHRVPDLICQAVRDVLSENGRRASPPKGSHQWLVLPYHPLWAEAGLPGIVARATEMGTMRALFARSFPSTPIPATVRVAWRLSGKPAVTNPDLGAQGSQGGPRHRRRRFGCVLW